MKLKSKPPSFALSFFGVVESNGGVNQRKAVEDRHRVKLKEFQSAVCPKVLRGERWRGHFCICNNLVWEDILLRFPS